MPVTPSRPAPRSVKVLITPTAYFGFYLKRFAPWLLDWIQHWGHRKATRKRLRRIEKSQAAGKVAEPAEAENE